MSSDVINAKFSYPLFENEKGYCIFLYKTDSNEKVTCTGNYLPKYDHLTFEMKGTWKKTEKHGMNFQVESWQEVIDNTKEGIIAFLASGMIEGIGIKTAEHIYAAFGNNSIEVLEKEPEQYLQIKGISKRKLEKIKESYAKNHCMRELTEFLLPYGITSKQTTKIYRDLKIQNVDTILAAPYALMQIHGVTVHMIDNIVRKNNLSLESEERLIAHVKHVLSENELDGNTGMNAEDFGIALLNSLRTPCYTRNNICGYVIELIKKGVIKYKKYETPAGLKTVIYRPYLFKLEEELAKKLLELSKVEQEPHENILQKIRLRCMELKIKLDKGQEKALLKGIAKSLMLLIGGPGTGKTTLIKLLAWFLEMEEPERPIYFVAPSGRAARRITESSGYPASTIHKFLHIRPGEEPDEDVVFENATIIIDEFSMVDVFLASMLFRSIKEGCRVIIIGDPGQLQSVGAGAVLRDIIKSNTVPMSFLTNIHRQSEGSMIYENAQNIVHGRHVIQEGSDFRIIQSVTPEEAQEKMIASYLAYVKKFGLQKVYCLCPCKDRTAGVKIMNSILQEKINPLKQGDIELEAYGMKFRKGDPVMYLKNGDEVSNGDIGYISEVREESDDGIVVYVTYFGDTILRYTIEEIEDLTLGYAFTVHKSQGSENDVVITYLSRTIGKKMLKRNLINTAITRGSHMVELYLTHDDALDTAIDNDDSESRTTSLQYHLEFQAGKFVRVS